MIKVIEKKQKKEKTVNYNDYPRDLRREIIYLYCQYDSSAKVCEQLARRYPTSREATSKNVNAEIRHILTDTYKLIKRQQNIYNDCVEKKLWSGNKEEQCWKPLISIYMHYCVVEKLGAG